MRPIAEAMTGTNAVFTEIPTAVISAPMNTPTRWPTRCWTWSARVQAGRDMAFASPLALTQTLPFLPLAQGDIDYQTERRDEPGLIPGLLNDPSTTVILVRDGLVAVPRGQGVLAARESVSMRLASLPGSYAAEALAGAPEAVAMFLGGYPGRRNAHVVAIDLTRVPMGAPSSCRTRTASGADDAFGNAAQPNTRERAGPAVARTAERFDLGGSARLRAPRLGAGGGPGHHGRGVEPGGTPRNGTARPAVPPYRRPWPAGRSGARTRRTGIACCSPAWSRPVIVAVVDSQDRLLLQHNRAWNDRPCIRCPPDSWRRGRTWSTPAVAKPRRRSASTWARCATWGSQPWPFPASLMVAFKAYALNTDIRTDGQETVDARWVSRDEYTAELIRGVMSAPNRAAIARYMIEEWYGRAL